MKKLLFLMISYIAINHAAHGMDLIKASKDGDHQQVTELLAPNANVNKKGVFGRTALQWASSNGHVEIVRSLLEYNKHDDKNKADINQQDIHGKTSLHLAVSNNCIPVVRLLLAYEAQPDKQDKLGDSPLHVAARSGYKEMVLLLLEHNADTELKNNLLATPLHAAAGAHKDEIVILLKKWPAMQLAAYQTKFVLCEALHKRVGENSPEDLHNLYIIKEIASCIQAQSFENETI